MENHCGITVASLSELIEKLKKISEEEYQNLVQSAQIIGKNIRSGFYLKSALERFD